GFVNFLRTASAEASAAWGQLGSANVDPDLRALGLLWQGKLESSAGDLGSARSHWQQAVDLGPTWYGGLRARGLLDPGGDVLTSPAKLDPARLEISPAEQSELDAWTSARGANLSALAAEQAADPSLARTDELLALGLKAEAGWEIDDQAVR